MVVVKLEKIATAVSESLSVPLSHNTHILAINANNTSIVFGGLIRFLMTNPTNDGSLGFADFTQVQSLVVWEGKRRVVAPYTILKIEFSQVTIGNKILATIEYE